ncbi:MAG: metallophosphoesterase [Pseudomonadota bacterium]
MVRVLHLTDPHLFADSAAELRGRNTHDTLSAVLAHYREHDWRADVVLATGDLIQDDTEAAYHRFRDHLATLDLPVVCAPGNHDIKALMMPVLSTPPFRYCGTFVQDNWVVVGMDTAVDGEVSGAVTGDELARVNAAIIDSGADFAVVGMHHPPAKMGSVWLDSVGLAEPSAVLAGLAETNKVRLALCGHVHQDFEATFGAIRCVTTPSTCRQFSKHSITFGVDDNPPAYRRLELAADGSQNSELVWVSIDKQRSQSL